MIYRNVKYRTNYEASNHSSPLSLRLSKWVITAANESELIPSSWARGVAKTKKEGSDRTGAWSRVRALVCRLVFPRSLSGRIFFLNPLPHRY